MYQCMTNWNIHVLTLNDTTNYAHANRFDSSDLCEEESSRNKILVLENHGGCNAHNFDASARWWLGLHRRYGGWWCGPGRSVLFLTNLVMSANVEGDSPYLWHFRSSEVWNSIIL